NYTVTGGSLAVTGNLLNASSFGEAVVTTASAADVSVQADAWLGSSATPWVGLVARYGGSGDSNQYWGGGGAGARRFYSAWTYKNVAGTWTLLASATFGSGGLPSFANGGTLRFDIQGSSLKLFYASSAGSPATLMASAVDAGLTGAGQGGGGGHDASWGNFSARPLPPPLLLTHDLHPAHSGTPGSNYTVTGGALAVTGNQLYASSFGEAVYNAATAADVSVQAFVALGTTGTGAAGLVARYSGSGDQNLYWATVSVNAGTYYAWIEK